MNYPDFSRACEIGIRRLTNSGAITFSQRVAIIDACLAAHSPDELPTNIRQLLTPEFDAMEAHLADVQANPELYRPRPTISASEVRPHRINKLFGAPISRPDPALELGPDNRFSVCELNRSGPPSSPTPATKSLRDAIETKAAKVVLRIEPYDPDAVDGDGDGIVQEGTAWERPVGTRLLTRAGKAIERGLTSTTRPQGLRIVDSDGNDVSYRPRYGEGIPEAPSTRPEKPTSKLGELGFPSLRESGHLSLIDLADPKPPEPPQPEKAAPTAKPVAASDKPISAVPKLPWVVGMDGVDNPALLEERASIAFGRLNDASLVIYDVVYGLERTLPGVLDDQQRARCQAILDAFTAEFGTGDQLQENFERYLLSDIADLIHDASSGEFLVNTSASDAIDILHEGRYYSQFVTGVSSVGHADLDTRRNIEQRFGVPLDAPDELRPIYGTVALPGDDTPYAERTAALTYGDITFILKPDVAERATFSVGDSYNTQFALSLTDAIGAAPDDAAVALGSSVAPELLGYLATKRFQLMLGELGVEEADAALLSKLAAHRFGVQYVDEPDLETLLDPTPLDLPLPLPNESFSYVEHQLHGGASLDDVAYIHIPPNAAIPDWLSDDLRRERLADNAAKDELRTLAKQRNIEVLDRLDSRPDVPERAGERASADVLTALGADRTPPLPYTPGPPAGTAAVHADDNISAYTSRPIDDVYMERWTQLVAAADDEYWRMHDALVAELEQSPLVDDPEGSATYILREATGVGPHQQDDQAAGEIVASMLLEHLREELALYADRPTLISTDAQAILQVLSEGRYRPASAVEGLETLGELRETYERAGLGVPYDLAPHLRPVYGHLDTRLEGDDVRSLIGAEYGDYHIVLNDAAKARTTMTYGDSLVGALSATTVEANHEDVRRTLVAVDDGLYDMLAYDLIATRLRAAAQRRREIWRRAPQDMSRYTKLEMTVTEAVTASVPTRFGPHLANKDVMRGSRVLDEVYIEAQVHGGVTLDDIAEIIIPDDAPDATAVRAAAKAKGIRVITESAARRETPSDKLVAEVINEYRTQMGYHSMHQATEDFMSRYTSSALDAYIHESNGELVFMDRLLEAERDELVQTLRDLYAKQQADGALSGDDLEELQLAALKIQHHDDLAAKVRARILERKARVVEGRPLDIDAAEIRAKHNLGALPDRAAWPPTVDRLGYTPDGSGAIVNSKKHAATFAQHISTELPQLLEWLDQELERLTERTPIQLSDGTSMSGAEFMARVRERMPSEAELFDLCVKAIEDDIADVRQHHIPMIQIEPLDFLTVLDGSDQHGEEPNLAGRIFSQFVTGTSGGLLDHSMRTWAERLFGGIPTDTAPTDRPIYGHLAASLRDVAKAEPYGTLSLILADAARERATFTLNDSLYAASGYPTHMEDLLDLLEPGVDPQLALEQGSSLFRALPLDAPPDLTDEHVLDGIDVNARSWAAGYLGRALTDVVNATSFDLGVHPTDATSLELWVRRSADRRGSQEIPSMYSYIELQLHGGVSLYDIDSIYVNRSEWALIKPARRARILRLCEEYGIDIVHTLPTR